MIFHALSKCEILFFARFKQSSFIVIVYFLQKYYILIVNNLDFYILC